MGSGGAEKHTVRVLNELSKLNYSIRVISPDKKGDYEDNLDKSIQLIKTGSKFLYKVSSTLGRFTTYWGLKREIKSFKPDLVFSVQDIHNVIALKAFRQLKDKPKLVLAVQNSVEDAYKNTSNFVNRIINNCIKNEYQRADKIIALSEGVKEGLIRMNPDVKSITEVIYNAGLDEDILSRFYSKNQTVKTKNEISVLVSCGRLTHQKGYPYMFEALKILKNKGILFEYQILGRGELENELKNLAKNLDLESQIQFLGFKSDPFSTIAQADIFVLPSLYEGFGNVIVEAMACGTPVISTNCPFGPDEIISSSELGMLVPTKNPTRLAEAIEELIKNPEKRELLSVKAKNRALDFKVSNIATAHHTLFNQIVHK